MGRNHVKRLAVPKSWELPRKRTIYMTKASPGAHAHSASLPLAILLRDVLGVAKTAREVKYILQQREVVIDGKRRKDDDFAVGIMDVLSLPQTKQHYRVHLTPRRTIGVVEIPASEEHKKLCRIVGKNLLNHTTAQITLSDGRTIRVEPKQYKVGDSLLIEVPTQKVLAHYPFAEGSAAYLVGGKHCGVVGSITRIDGNMINIKAGEMEFQTPKHYVFVAGKDKPAVTIQ